MSPLASEWALRWSLWMLPVVWQVTLLALGVFVADLLLRRVVWPQLLHALWLLVPLRLLLPPHLSSPVAIAPRVDAAIAGNADALPWFITGCKDDDRFVFEVRDPCIGESGKAVIMETFTRRKDAK